MDIKYKIVEVDEGQHSIVVRYYTDEVSEAELVSFFESDGKPAVRPDGEFVRCRSDVSLSLPIPAPRGDALKAIILANAPGPWLEAITLGKRGAFKPGGEHDMSHIRALHGKEHRGVHLLPRETATPPSRQEPDATIRVRPIRNSENPATEF